MFDSVYSIALDILGKIGGDTSKRYLSTYDIALAILGVLGGDTTKKFDSVYSILLDIYRARFGSALSGMDSSYSILEEINKSFDPSDTTHYDSSYSILVSIDGQPGLIGHVFSIVTDAANTVIINGVETRSVSVREGENVVWSVERRGYVSQNGTYTMGDEDYTETVTLVKEQYTFSIVATPADATVTINGEVRSSITADYGTSITWEVSKEGYTTQSNTETLTGDTTRNITLTEVQYTFTIVPTPADATVMINGVQQSSVTVSDGTTLTWEVSKTGFKTQTGSYTIAGADHTENVTLAADAFMIKGTATSKPTLYYNGTSDSVSERGTKMTVNYDSSTGEFIASCPTGVRPTSMAYAAYNQKSITSINYIGDLSNCTTIRCMFRDCANMTNFNADISISGVCTDAEDIFTYCNALKVINIPNRVDYYGFIHTGLVGYANSLESIYCRGTNFDSGKTYSGRLFSSNGKSVKYIEVEEPRQVGHCTDITNDATLKLWNVVNKKKISNDGVSSVDNSYLPVSGPYLKTGTTTYNQAYATEGVFNIDLTERGPEYVNYLKNVLVRYITVQSYSGVTVWGYRYTRIWISEDHYWENDFDLDKEEFRSSLSGEYKTGYFPLNSWTLKTGSMPSNT